MNHFIKTVIIEDNFPLATGYKKIIDASNKYKVISIYQTCEKAIENLKDDAPDIILMDIELPNMDGVEGTKIIKKKYPDIEILIITVYENSQTVFDALCAGAAGYLSKNSSKNELVKALDELMDGGAPMSINIAKMVVSSFRKSTNSILTERETEVLSLLSSGKSYNSVAEKLFISINTIRFHIKNIYEKLQVNSREEAIEKANKDRII